MGVGCVCLSNENVQFNFVRTLYCIVVVCVCVCVCHRISFLNNAQVKKGFTPHEQTFRGDCFVETGGKSDI